MYPVLHAQSEGFETYFVVDAVGGSSVTAHDTAIQRRIQAGSRPVTLNALQTEWIRDWRTTPYADAFMDDQGGTHPSSSAGARASPSSPISSPSER